MTDFCTLVEILRPPALPIDSTHAEKIGEPVSMARLMLAIDTLELASTDLRQTMDRLLREVGQS